MKTYTYPSAGGLGRVGAASLLSVVLLRLRHTGRAFAGSLVIALSVLSVGAVNAKDNKDLGIELVAQRVIALPSGGEKLKNDVAVDPGDVVQYTAVYTNHSSRPLRQVAPTLPIPVGLELIPETTSIAPALASVDGKKFEPYPIRRTQKLADGRETQVEVPASDYRALRWNPSDLAPGTALKITVRARVSTSTTVALR